MAFLPTWLRQFPGAVPNESCNPTLLRAGTGATSFWEVFDAETDSSQQLRRGLKAYGETFRPYLGGLYDFKARYQARNPQSACPFLVDIGGADGAFVTSLLGQTKARTGLMPEVVIDPASVIIQDLDGPIAAARENPDIPKDVVLQVHDFAQPQTFKSADIYHIRACLHDYDDAKCTTILSAIRAGMGADSRLLIADDVLPSHPSNESVLGYYMDVCMMNFGGRERTEQEMRSLLEASGLACVEIFRANRGTWAMIEAKAVLDGYR